MHAEAELRGCFEIKMVKMKKIVKKKTKKCLTFHLVEAVDLR